MKIGEIRHRAPVQSLGRYNIALPAAQSRAVTETINAANQTLQQIEKIEAEAEYAESMANLENGTNALQTRMAATAQYERQYLEELGVDIPTTPEEHENLTFRQQIPAYEVQNQVFEREMDKLVTAVKSDMRMPSARLQFENTVPGLQAQMQGVIMTDTLKRQNSAALGRFMTAYDQAVKQGYSGKARAETSIDQMEAMNLISRETAAEMRAALPANLEIEDINLIIAQNDSPSDLEALSKHIRSKDYNGAMDNEQRTLMAQKLQRRSKNLEAEYAADWDERHSDFITDLRFEVMNGRVTQAELDMYRKNQRLGFEREDNNKEWLYLSGMLRNATARAEKEQMVLSEYLNSDGMGDYNLKQDRDKATFGADYEYELLKQENPEAREIDLRGEAIYRSLMKTGVAPKQLHSMISKGVMHENVDMLTTAAKVLLRTPQYRKNLGADFSNQFKAKEYAEFDMFMGSIAVGVAPDKAMAELVKRRAMTPETRAYVDKQYNQELLEEEPDWQSLISAAVAPGWESNPDVVNQNLIGIAQRESRLAYQGNGDIEDAIRIGVERATSGAGKEVIGVEYGSEYPMLQAFPMYNTKEGLVQLEREIQTEVRQEMQYDGPIMWRPVMDKSRWVDNRPVYVPWMEDPIQGWIPGLYAGWQPNYQNWERSVAVKNRQKQIQYERKKSKNQEALIQQRVENEAMFGVMP